MNTEKEYLRLGHSTWERSLSASICMISGSFTVEVVDTGIPNRKDDLKSGRKKVAAFKYL